MIRRQPIQLLLNDNIRAHDRQRGVTRYFTHVANALLRRFGRQARVCSPELARYDCAGNGLRTLRFPGSGRLGVHDLCAAAAARRVRPRVMFSAYYGNARTGAAEVFPVYDMIHEWQSGPAYGPDRFGAEKRRCLERAAALLAISRHTAQDIATFYPYVDPAKIHVTPLGVDQVFFEPAAPAERILAQPHLLYVGSRGGHKNFLRLLAAFGQSGLAGAIELRVIAPTGSAFDADERSCLQQYGLSDCVRLASAESDAALRDEYAASIALAYPSEYEGFGLPVAEAMASGTLVATSSVSSMPEIGGDAVFYFDPASTESISACLREIASLPADQRYERIAMGQARTRQFTWERCEEQTLRIFERLLQ